MKRVIKQPSRFEGSFTHAIKGSRNKYFIYYNDIDNPEDFMAQVEEIHPYSAADYVWARIGYREPMSVEYIQAGEIIEYEPGDRDEFRSDWRDFYEDGEDYTFEAIDNVCYKLNEYNKDIWE